LITNSTWVPQIVHAVVPGGSFATVGLIAAIPPFAAILTMSIWGKDSDRRRERRWHVVLPMILAALGWLCVALLDSPTGRLVGLVFCAVGTFSAQNIFWTLPSTFLSAEARPIGLVMINTIGMVGTAIGPVVVGGIKDYIGTFTAALIFVAGCILLGAVCVFGVPLGSKGRQLHGATA
jgi:MFS transporter, ACS family, 4-hydroxyphenylacetate permease